MRSSITKPMRKEGKCRKGNEIVVKDLIVAKWPCVLTAVQRQEFFARAFRLEA